MARAMPVTENVAQSARHSTFYLACGGAEAPPVIFVHGWPELSYSWRHQIPAIAAAGYRVVAPDWHTLDEPARLADTDAWLAQELNTLRHRLSTRAFSPLPLLGIPGLTPAAWNISTIQGSIPRIAAPKSAFSVCLRLKAMPHG